MVSTPAIRHPKKLIPIFFVSGKTKENMSLFFSRKTSSPRP
jgi:hypothetical protein